MKFNETGTEKDGLIQDCERIIFNSEYGAISGDTDRLATFTQNINTALDRAVAIIMEADHNWRWDDSNRTDYPIATTDLDTTDGSEQQDYTLEVSHELIWRVEVKDSNGNWQKLHHIDETEIYEGLQEFRESPGLPKYYRTVANSIFLYPKPGADSVTETNGLKVYFQRNAERFTTNDTSKSPGIPSTFHPFLSTYASWRYARDNSLENADELRKDKEEWANQMASFFNNRNQDENIRMRNGAIRRTSFR